MIKADANKTNENIWGWVEFWQPATGPSEGQIKITASLENLFPEGKHGFHLHEFGDLKNGCKSTGERYNPFDKPHGAPTEPKNRTVGSLGNIRSSWRGLADYYRWDNLVKLNGP